MFRRPPISGAKITWGIPIGTGVGLWIGTFIYGAYHGRPAGVLTATVYLLPVVGSFPMAYVVAIVQRYLSSSGVSR